MNENKLDTTKEHPEAVKLREIAQKFMSSNATSVDRQKVEGEYMIRMLNLQERQTIATEDTTKDVKNYTRSIANTMWAMVFIAASGYVYYLFLIHS